MQDLLALFLNKGTLAECNKKQFLIKQGAICDKVYYVQQGVTRHFVVTPEGHEKTIRISKENDFFYSSIVSYYRNEPSYIYCQCLTDCRLIYWERSRLEALFGEYPDLGEFSNQQHIEFILEKHKKEISLLTRNASERFNEFCLENGKLFNRIPHHIIASYLDVTPETLSRLRSGKS